MDIVSSGSLCKPLPEKVKNSIRSSINIVSVVDCVEELVLNSLDAQATLITINVDLSNFRIKVDDNGIGIAPEDLKLIGARYTTSKCSSVEDLQNLRYYGYRGEALASIAQLSTLVEVFTRQEITVYSRKLKEDNSGLLVKGNLAKKPTKGTTVVVTGFLSKAVVRQKRIHPTIELEEIKSSIESIALIHPRVAFNLTDDEKSTKLLSLSSCLSTKDVFRQLYGCKYGIGGAHKLLEVSGQFDVFFFTVFVSSKLCQQKSYQHFYVNKRLIGRCQYNRMLNDALRELMDGNSNNNAIEKTQEERGRIGVGRISSEVNKNKYPIFIVNIQCPVSEYDITFEPRKKLVEFKRKKVMEELIETIICRCKAAINSDNRLEENCIIEKNSKGGATKRNSSILGKSITTYAIKRAVHSRVVQRNSDQLANNKNNNNSFQKETTVYSEFNEPSFSPVSHSIISENSRRSSPIPKTNSRISYTNENSNTSFIDRRRSSNQINNNHSTASNARFSTSAYKSRGVSSSTKHDSSESEEDELPLPENYLVKIVNDQLKEVKPKVEITSPGSKLRQFVKGLPKLLLHVEKNHEEPVSTKTPENLYQRTPMQIKQIIRNLVPMSYSYATADLARNKQATHENLHLGTPVQPEPFIKSIEPIPYISDLPDDNDIDIQIVDEQPSTTVVNNCPENYHPFDEENQYEEDQFNDDDLPASCWTTNIDLCQFITDSKGIKWIETPDLENGLFIYTSIDEKKEEKIISKQKLTPQQLALLNMNQKPAFTRPHFSFQKDYLEQTTNEGGRRRTLTKDGKLNLIKEGKSLFNNNVIEVLNGYAEYNYIKWRNPEQLLENTTTIEEIDNNNDDNDQFTASNYWQRPTTYTSTGQLPSLTNFGRTADHLFNCTTTNSKYLNNFVFKKEDLANVKVINQLDNKFIVGTVTVNRETEEDILVIFDQHGAHERVRLEMFTKDVYEPVDNGSNVEGGSKQKRISRVIVRPPILLHFSPTEIRVLKSFCNELEMVGIIVEVCDDAGSVNVTNIPKCFAEKISTEKSSTRDETIVKLTSNLIQEQLSYLLDTKQPRTTLPKTIHELLCSQACHGAIKFGDNLTLEACMDLIKSLSQCQTPFQCAHGRPIIYPLCNLVDLPMIETCAESM